ncbi:HAD family hydrolase [bacterium E08(2017)]|nr:HAD family hydrolase [bacterium E08(2017)]
MKPQAIIFDLDGTLLDTLRDLADSVNEVLEARSFPTHPVLDYRLFVGSGIYKLIERALPEGQRDESLIAECVMECKATYKKNWNRTTSPFPGVAELLDGLTERKIPFAINTNKPQKYADLNVQEFLAKWQFAEVVGQREDMPMKPDPAGPLMICEVMGIDAEACIYLGDSDVDMQTGINSGMTPIGAAWGFRNSDELVQAGAKAVIDHPMELIDVIETFKR